MHIYLISLSPLKQASAKSERRRQMNRKIGRLSLIVILIAITIPMVAVASAQGPSVTFNPETAIAGTTVEIICTGFSPNSQLTIAFAPEWGISSMKLTTDSQGSVTGIFTVPEGLAAGSYGINVNGAHSQHVSVVFTVAPTIPAPEYGLGILGALGACFAGFIVLNKRSSLPHFKQ
jgi:hypothetical protein